MPLHAYTYTSDIALRKERKKREKEEENKNKQKMRAKQKCLEDRNKTWPYMPRSSDRNDLYFGWVLLYVHRNRRLIREGSFDFHTAPALWSLLIATVSLNILLMSGPKAPATSYVTRMYALMSHSLFLPMVKQQTGNDFEAPVVWAWDPRWLPCFIFRHMVGECCP